MSSCKKGTRIEVAPAVDSAQGVENVDFARADVDEAGTGAPPFDAVLAFNLLHLLRDVPMVLTTIRGKLKPGGIFISKSGCLSEAPFLLRRLMLPAMQLIGKAPYVNSFSAAGIDQMITAAGFKILETKTYSGMAPTRLIIAQKLD